MQDMCAARDTSKGARMGDLHSQTEQRDWVLCLTSGQAARRRALAPACQTPGGSVRFRAADGPASVQSWRCETGTRDDA